MSLVVSGTARLLIETLQREALAARGLPASRDDYEARKWRAFADLVRHERGTASSQAALHSTEGLLRDIGPFQNPDHLFLLVLHGQHLLDTARLMGPDWVIEEDITVASTYTASFNAITYALPRRRGHLIVVDDGLIVLSFILGALLAVCYGAASEESRRQGLPFITADVVRSGITPATPAAVLTAKAIVTYVETGNPRALIGVLPPAVAPDGWVRLFADGMLRYVVGHELGHVHEGHFSEAGAAPAGDASDGGVPQVPFGWTREVEADAYGGMLALQATFRHKVPPGLAALTVECGQMVRVLVDRAREVLETGSVVEVRVGGSSSHPPAEIRLELLRHALDIAARINPALTGVAEAHDISDAFLGVLRDAVDAACLEARGRGVRPLVPLRRDQHVATP